MRHDGKRESGSAFARHSYRFAFIAAMFAGALGVSGCASAAEARIGEPFGLAVGESATLKECDVTLTFDRVANDSRCPRGTNCIWAGDAEVIVSVAHGGSRSTVTLHASGVSGEGAQTLPGGCTVELVGLSPEPDQSGPIAQEDYAATLLVREGTQ